MAYGVTALDLKRDALGLAGEPDDGTSEYDSDVYEWLTVVQRTLVSGGQFGPSVLEPMDWGWARAWPRGSMQLIQPVNRDFALSASFTTGSPVIIVTISGGVGPDLVGFRIMRTDVAARHLVVTQELPSATQLVLTLQDPWTGPSDTIDDWWAYPDTYRLPADFVRGCSPLFVAGADLLVGPVMIDLLDPVDLERQYPHGATQGGMPECAARVTHDRVRFSHYLDTPSAPQNVQVEFEYIRRPPVLAEGVIPLVPIEHRRVLAYGCAYLILDDKGDSTAPQMWQMFQAQYKAMRDEEVRDRRRMSTRWGVVQPARAFGRSIWRTESGLPVYLW